MTVARLRSAFQEAGLQSPWVPPEFAPHLRQHSRWCFSTLEASAPSAYDFRAYQALAATDLSFLVIGHAGHGINSYALSYFLKRDSFSLLLQLSWGGAYMQEPQTTERVNAMFAVLNECAGQLPVTEGRIESSDFYSEERLEPGTLRALLSVTHT